MPSICLLTVLTPKLPDETIPHDCLIESRKLSVSQGVGSKPWAWDSLEDLLKMKNFQTPHRLSASDFWS